MISCHMFSPASVLGRVAPLRHVLPQPRCFSAVQASYSLALIWRAVRAALAGMSALSKEGAQCRLRLENSDQM